MGRERFGSDCSWQGTEFAYHPITRVCRQNRRNQIEYDSLQIQISTAMGTVAFIFELRTIINSKVYRCPAGFFFRIASLDTIHLFQSVHGKYRKQVGMALERHSWHAPSRRPHTGSLLWFGYVQSRAGVNIHPAWQCA